MKFPERVKYRQAIMVYKSVNNICPVYLKDKFKHSHNVYRVNLRSSVSKLNLYPPKPRLEFFRKSFDYTGTKVWNALPNEVREAENLASFKNKYIAYWKTST